MTRRTAELSPDPFGEARPGFTRVARALRGVRDTVLAICALGGALALLWLVAPGAYAWLIRNEDGNGDLILVGIVVAAVVAGVLGAGAQGIARWTTARSRRRHVAGVVDEAARDRLAPRQTVTPRPTAPPQS